MRFLDLAAVMGLEFPVTCLRPQTQHLVGVAIIAHMSGEYPGKLPVIDPEDLRHSGKVAYFAFVDDAVSFRNVKKPIQNVEQRLAVVREQIRQFLGIDLEAGNVFLRQIEQAATKKSVLWW